MHDRGGEEGAVLVVNAGSSSIKLAVFERRTPTAPVLSVSAERIGTPEAAAEIRSTGGEREKVELEGRAANSHKGALSALLPRLDGWGLPRIAAVGHRIVHGGDAFTRPTKIDPGVLDRLERLVPLARTHQPYGIAAIRQVAKLWPSLPQIACFDTAFHATIPEAARTIALPPSVRDAGVRRYGFHGLSYAWIAEVLPARLGAVTEGRVVAAHLGNGASLCGMVERRSRATTMSFTPLDGLVMGERPGLTDPGAVLFMLEEMGMSIVELRDMLFRQSGLLGLSGLSNDMRTLAASEAPAARFAIEVYVHRVVREIGAVAAEIGGIDALVFTGGVGENAASVRAAIVERLAWLGFALDPDANARNAERLSLPDAIPVVIVPANEEAMIAQAALQRVSADEGRDGRR